MLQLPDLLRQHFFRYARQVIPYFTEALFFKTVQVCQDRYLPFSVHKMKAYVNRAGEGLVMQCYHGRTGYRAYFPVSYCPGKYIEIVLAPIITR